MAEIRTFSEGSLRWVQQSGSGLSWATGTTPPSGLLAFVREGATYNSAQTVITVMERGRPSHQKIVEYAPIDISFDLLLLNSASLPNALTASGTTTPMIMLEHRASAAELGASGIYHQFYGVAYKGLKFSEAKDGDKDSLTFVALAMTGPTASGFLS